MKEYELTLIKSANCSAKQLAQVKLLKPDHFLLYHKDGEKLMVLRKYFKKVL